MMKAEFEKIQIYLNNCYILFTNKTEITQMSRGTKGYQNICNQIHSLMPTLQSSARQAIIGEGQNTTCNIRQDLSAQT